MIKKKKKKKTKMKEEKEIFLQQKTHVYRQRRFAEGDWGRAGRWKRDLATQRSPSSSSSSVSDSWDSPARGKLTGGSEN